MSTLERSLEVLKASSDSGSDGEAMDRIISFQAARPDAAGTNVLAPLTAKLARPVADANHAMRSIWEIYANGALYSQFRNIRRELDKQLAALKTTPRVPVVAVTSALPGEGKSFLSLGLANALTNTQDREVVLVDADVPKRDLSKQLGLAGQPGLVECLASETSVSSVLCRTDLAALNFLPAGQWRSDAPDLLSSAKMDRVLESIRHCEGRRIFVLDTAPILAFGETAYLAERVDLVLLVVRAGLTPRPAAEEALRKLKADRPVALVLNGQQGSILDAYYGYGDSYGDYHPGREK